MEIGKMFKFNLNKKDYKKAAVLILLVVIGIFLLVSGNSPNRDKDIYDERTYVEELENKIESVLEKIDGVGSCDVVVTLENSGEAVYSSVSFSTSPQLIKTNQPTVRGVAVVFEGADNPSVQNDVINTVKSLTNVSASKISVSKKSS